jgi:hypothetical protein
LQSVLLNEAFINDLKNWIETRTNKPSKEISLKTLKYQATVDGFQASKFHTKCDGITRLLVVVKNKNNFVFGGFTTVAFHSNENGAFIASNDKASFLFSLINPHKTQAIFFPIHNEQYTIDGYKNFGATFGGGYDLFIVNNSNIDANSYSNLGDSYTDDSGRKETFFNGQQNLGLISEILAFEV